MQDIVDAIVAVGGVNGAAIYGPQGVCVAHRLVPPYELILVNEAMNALRGALDYQSQLGGTVGDNTAIVLAEQGSLAIRGIEGFYLLALCNNDTNLAMLSVAFNVARLKIERLLSAERSTVSPLPACKRPEPGADLSTQAVTTRGKIAPPQEPPNGFGDTHRSDPPPPLSSPRDKADLQRSSFRTGADMSWDGVSQSIPVGAVGSRLMRHLLETLMDHIGAQARPTLERELRRMGSTPRTLDPSQFADLIRVAAGYVEPPEERKRFVAEVLGDRRRSRS